jgi:hypothetical protein
MRIRRFFVQCLHQHTPLIEVLRLVKERPDLVEKYLNFKRHVCRQEFYDEETAASWDNHDDTKPSGRRKEVEAEWPE